MAVLITRPLADSIVLQQHLNVAHITSFIYPTLEIKQLHPALIKNYQIVVFISKNSVDYGVHHLEQLDNYIILAVGATTAQQLKQYGYSANFYPQHNPSSQSLLAIGEVAQIQNKNILIIRGKGGVETLKNSFIKHNNNVDYLEVYDRVINKNIAKYQQNLYDFLRQNKQIIIITSCDILDALLQLTKNIDKNTTLLVVSSRVEKYAQHLGFTSIIKTDGIGINAIMFEAQKWLTKNG